MNDHLSNSQVILFQARALPPAQMMAALEHLAQCLRCRQRSHEQFQATNAYQASTITLSHVLQWQHEHLAAEQVKAFANKSLASEDKEIAQAHLQTCQHCRAEVQDWLAFEEELKIELRTRYGPKPIPKQSWQWQLLWPAWQWKPVFATTFAAACLLTTTLFILYQGQRQSTRPIATASPAVAASVIQPAPSAPPTPPSNATRVIPEENVVASLRDRTSLVAMTTAGNLVGLDKIPDELRGDIIAALRTGKPNKPALLNDLTSEVGAVRGKAVGEVASPLRAPVGITIWTNRPVLQWQPVEKASGYEVQIADGRGNEIALSERLPASIHRWQPPQALKRGAIYTWTVRAIHEEPATTAMPPTSRFKVLEATKARELARLKAYANSHLGLGLFYARVGMLPEAERELKALAKRNPDSPLARKLLQTVQAWR